jgi:hypothetical protein
MLWWVPGRQGAFPGYIEITHTPEQKKQAQADQPKTGCRTGVVLPGGKNDQNRDHSATMPGRARKARSALRNNQEQQTSGHSDLAALDSPSSLIECLDLGLRLSKPYTWILIPVEFYRRDLRTWIARQPLDLRDNPDRGGGGNSMP